MLPCGLVWNLGETRAREGDPKTVNVCQWCRSEDVHATWCTFGATDYALSVEHNRAERYKAALGRIASGMSVRRARELACAALSGETKR